MKEITYSDLPTPLEFLKNKSIVGTIGDSEAEFVFQILLKISIDAGKWMTPTIEDLTEILNRELADTSKNKSDRNLGKKTALLEGLKYMRVNGYVSIRERNSKRYIVFTQKALDTLKNR